MSNSKLVNYTLYSPNRSARTGKISKITIHHMAVVWTVEQCGQSFFSSARKASSNYGIDSDGRVGLYVPEDFRSWCSSNSANDNLAVTIEVSNSVAAYPWPVSDKAYEKLIELCVDICQRNGIPELVYTGTTAGNLTRHNLFAATLCPGPYLEERFPAIAEEVNKRLRNGSIYPVEETEDAGGEPPAHTGDVENVVELVDRKISEALNEVRAVLAGEWSEPSEWIVKSGELAEAVSAGITDGTRPKGYATREEVAAMVLRVYQKLMAELHPPDGGAGK